MTGTAAEALRRGEEVLRETGISNAAWETREMLAAALGCSPLRLVVDAGKPLASAAAKTFDSFLSARRERKPLAYVLGNWDFAGLRLSVSESVLVPRPETEELWELACEGLLQKEAPLLADVGTGSGCLAIALARHFPGARVWATDVSAEALDVARGNAEAQGVSSRVSFFRGDLLSPLPAEMRGRLDGIVANLPYIPDRDIAGLDPEVLCEPRVALDGGPDGLGLVRRLIPQAREWLAPEGALFLEVGFDQGERVAAEVGNHFSSAAVHRDMSGRGRFVRGVK